MKIVCVDPISRSGRLCAVSIFNQDGFFLLQRVLDLSKVPLNNKHTYICYDLLRILNIDFDIKIDFYDVKLIYELQHKKFNDLSRLGIDVLGHDRMYRYLNSLDKLQAHLRSYRVTNIDPNFYAEEQLFPADVLRNHYKEKSCAIVMLWKELRNFDFEADILRFYPKVNHYAKELLKTAKNPLYVDPEGISEGASHHISAIRKAAVDNKLNLKFNVIGAKNGRLSFKKGTPNIYALPRSMRSCIIAPMDHQVVQFDFKSLHPRIAIATTDDEEFKTKFKDIEDIYSLFTGERQKTKVEFLAWMYSDHRSDKFESEAAPIYDLKKQLWAQAKRDGKLVNPFGRPLFFNADDNLKIVFQNYITSIEVDMMLSVLGWINNALKNRLSKVVLPYHDALIFYIHNDETELIDSIKKYLEVHHATRFNSKFPVEVMIGRNFGEMECDIKHLTK